METAQAIVNGTNHDTPAESGPAPRSVDWENPRVEAILTAAAKCFARRGFNATTLAEIGKELGLRKSIVHYYFASKAALVQEVQSFSYQRMLASTRTALDGSRSHSLYDALHALWNALHSDGTTKGLNIEIWSATRRDPEIRRRAAAMQNDARRLLEDHFASQVNDPDAFATLTLAVLDGLAVAEAVSGDKARTRAAFDAFVRMTDTARGEARSSAA